MADWTVDKMAARMDILLVAQMDNSKGNDLVGEREKCWAADLVPQMAAEQGAQKEKKKAH